AAGPGRPGEVEHELRVGDRVVGRLLVDSPEPTDEETADRVSSLVASLLAAAIDREQLAREARVSEARRQRDAIEAEALRRSDAAKTAVLRSVSHDLRSPITAIMAASDVLGESSAALSAAERAELVGSIGLQAERLHRLV